MKAREQKGNLENKYENGVNNRDIACYRSTKKLLHESLFDSTFIISSNN